MLLLLVKHHTICHECSYIYKSKDVILYIKHSGMFYSLLTIASSRTSQYFTAVLCLMLFFFLCMCMAQVLSHNLYTALNIPHDPVALEEHFKDNDNGPVSDHGYMPYLNKYILAKVSVLLQICRLTSVTSCLPSLWLYGTQKSSWCLCSNSGVFTYELQQYVVVNLIISL